MKKLLLLVIPLLVLGAAGGALWWKYGRGHDALAHAQELIDRGDLRGAQLELRGSLRTDPGNAGAHFRLGQVEQRLGDPVAAEKEYRLARDRGYEARTVNPLLAQAYLSQGRYRDLLRDFPVQGLPADQAAQILNLRALAQISLGDAKAALASSSEAERDAPQSIEAALSSARSLIAQQDYAGAEAKTDRALQINARSPEALLLKGQLQNIKGDRVRALDAFDAVLALNPRNLAARLERANILLMDGKDDRAREDVNAALSIEPRSSMGTYLHAVLAVKAEDYATADADLTKIGSIIGRFPKGLFFYAIAKYNLGQAEQASDAASKFLAKNPNDPDAIKLFSRIELAGRRSSGVISLIGRAQQSGIADADMLDLLGRAYALAGKPDLALQNLERAAALAPQNADILTRLAALRLSLGDTGRAASDFEHSLDLAPQQAGAAEQLVLAAISGGEIDRATLALDRLRKIQGESEAVGNLSALIRMAQLDLDGAGAILRDTIKKYPDATQPRINLAKVDVLQDKAAEAETLLGEVLDRKPADVPALNTLVSLLIADGKPAEALARLQQGHAAAPKDPDVTVALANQDVRIGDSKAALALVDEMLKDQPTNTSLLVAEARLLVSLGRPDDAELAYHRVLDENPLDADTRRVISDLRMAAKDPVGARNVLADGLKADPGNPDLMKAMLAVSYRNGGLDAALATADELGRAPGNMPNARWLRGDALMGAGRFTDAVPEYSAGFRADPGTTGLLRLVNALNASGRADQATAVLRDWLGNNPADAAAAEELASLDIVARRFFEAETHLNLVLAQRPSDSNALNNLAWVYQQRADGRARAVAQKSYLLNPTPEAADTLGWILVTSGNAATGLTLLRQAHAHLERDPTVTYHYAFALNATGRKAEAAAALRPIVQSLMDFDDRNAAARLLADLTTPAQ